MGIKKSFLIGYLSFVLLALIIFIVFIATHLLLNPFQSNQPNEKVEQANKKTVECENKNKVLIFLTDKTEPLGRVVKITRGIISCYDWKNVESAIVEKEEMETKYPECENYIFIQYDKWPY